MLKNIIWMVSGLALGLLIWAAYAQYKKAKDKRAAAEAAAVAAGAPTTPTTTPTTTPPTTGSGPAAPTVNNTPAPGTSNLNNTASRNLY